MELPVGVDVCSSQVVAVFLLSRARASPFLAQKKKHKCAKNILIVIA
jgi:hypothetical protein